MADYNQFGSVKPGQPGNPQQCAQCEAMIADALDGTLSPADQATFDLHLLSCAVCSAMVADAQRGAAWMEMLKSSRPEPPDALLARILAQTSGQTSAQTRAGVKNAPPIVLGGNDFLRVPPAPNTLLGRPAGLSPTSPGAVVSASNVLPFRSRLTHSLRSIGHTMLQPRLAMTAAMAFFSIALTMNLTGVHISNLRASDLKPSSILRSCYETKARVVRYSDNLRVVYELESRVRDLQHASDDGSASEPASQSAPAANPNQDPAGSQQPDQTNPGNQTPGQPSPNQKQNRPRPNPGSSRRESPIGNLLRVQSVAQNGLETAPLQVFVLSSKDYKQEGELV